MHFDAKSKLMVFLLFFCCFSPKALFNSPCALQCVPHNWKYFFRLFVISPSLLAKGDWEKNWTKWDGTNQKESSTDGSIKGWNKNAERPHPFISAPAFWLVRAVLPLAGRGKETMAEKHSRGFLLCFGVIHLLRLGNCVWPAEDKRAVFRQGTSFYLLGRANMQRCLTPEHTQPLQSHAVL